MKKLLPMTLLTIAATTATAGAQSLSGVELGLTGGYAGGLSGEFFVHAPNVAGPVGVKAGVSYTRAADAINDNNDGTAPGPADGTGPFTFGDLKQNIGATEYGSYTSVSLDGTYDLGELSPGVDATFYGGGRYGMFRSVEDYGSDGNVTYTSNAFGLGAGVMVSYALTGGLSLVGDLGVDHYFKSSITTGGSNTNAAGTYAPGSADYAAYDDRFVRPGTVFKARIGVKTSF
ncbi:hypothetical protein DEIGR_102222 [Deinococcus grandis]|uniref:Outer membrane protein beta-barrel domain-containing protein n=1 Tax=Deinococcus grandis TaxID=57498 RepID=A0A100HK31_9DEIO|nr:hypothetical protein [Deinococcus grandis]BBN94305.1 hypothetical protein DEGR_10380 [Deinococcus grandis]GAQ22195.1 hypothetical protein DEIGR_102222 [Deinococcus grandis]